MIRRLQNDFVAVSVAAGNMHRPAPGLENQLLRAIGASGPAPQGIAVLNGDGQVLDWVLMFDDEPSVLRFLDHARERFESHPDASQPFMTERYQRFPGVKRDDVPAHTVVVPKDVQHSGLDRCPAESRYKPGTMIAKVVGRRVTEEGKLTGDTVNQEDYSQDRFTIYAEMQQRLADGLAGAEGRSVEVPANLARLWVSYAYMGMLDVRPINNPGGADSHEDSIDFQIGADPEHPGWYRITGSSHVAARLDRRKGDGSGFENDVQLTWQGFARIENNRMTSLLLRGDGSERLYWNPGGPPGPIASGPEVANLPAGRRVDWSGPVSFSIIGEPAKPEQISATATESIAKTPEEFHRALQERLPLLREQMEKDGGRSMQTIGPLMKEFQNLIREQRFEEASQQLDRIFAQFEKAPKG